MARQRNRPPSKREGRVQTERRVEEAVIRSLHGQLLAAKLVVVAVVLITVVFLCTPNASKAWSNSRLLYRIIWFSFGIVWYWLYARNLHRVTLLWQRGVGQTNLNKIRRGIASQMFLLAIGSALAMLPPLYSFGVIAALSNVIASYLAHNTRLSAALAWTGSAALSGLIGNACFYVISRLMRGHDVR
jgi:hypothetical protein